MSRVTLKDIAQQVSLSPTHVSRILRGQGGMDPRTRQRVLSVARRLGYQPNLSARGLVLNRTNTIGVLVPEVNTPYFAEYLLAVQNQLQHHGLYALAGYYWGEPDPGQASRTMLAKGVDGLIVLGNIQPELQQECQARGLPVIASVFTPDETSPAASHHVAYDDREGGRLAAEHLLELGHRRLAYFTLNHAHPENETRYQALREASRRAGIDAAPRIEAAAADLTMEQGYQTSGALAQAAARGEMDAIFCTCDSLAIGLLRRLAETGVRVPQDVSVIGYDDLAMACFTNPPLTTVAQPTGKLAPLIVELMLKLLAGEGVEPGVRHSLLLRPALQVRQSTAPRRA